MEQTADTAVLTTEPTPAPSAVLPRTPWLGAALLLFRMTFARQLKSKKTLAVALLFSLPIVFVLLRPYSARPGSLAATRSPLWLSRTEYRLVFWFIPQALLPFAALLYASGMIQDEVEEQTLTYLLVRPIPRWAIYGAKFAATAAVTILLTVVFTTATYAALYWGLPELWGEIIPGRVWKICSIFGLTVVAYCSLFGLLSLIVRRVLVVGVAYIFVFEGVLANLNFVVLRITVMYWLRLLARRWLELPPRNWGINLASAPTATTAVLVLVLASLAATLLAFFVFSRREFRVKTPAGT